MWWMKIKNKKLFFSILLPQTNKQTHTKLFIWIYDLNTNGHIMWNHSFFFFLFCFIHEWFMSQLNSIGWITQTVQHVMYIVYIYVMNFPAPEQKKIFKIHERYGYTEIEKKRVQIFLFQEFLISDKNFVSTVSVKCVTWTLFHNIWKCLKIKLINDKTNYHDSIIITNDNNNKKKLNKHKLDLIIVCLDLETVKTFHYDMKKINQSIKSNILAKIFKEKIGFQIYCIIISFVIWLLGVSNQQLLFFITYEW